MSQEDRARTVPNGPRLPGVTSLPADVTTSSEDEEGGLTDIQVNFLIVGVLFVVVVLLAIANLYIKRFSRKSRHVPNDDGCGPVHTISHAGGDRKSNSLIGGGIGGGSSSRSTRTNLLF